jgi:tRNA (cmo5U34)-methyltransferase
VSKVMLAPGDALESHIGGWSFDGRTVPTFDAHVRKSVPFYDDAHSLVVKLSDFFVKNGSLIYDIGCSTGTLLSRLEAQHRDKSCHYVGIDDQAAMVDAARERCRSASGIELLKADARLFELEPADLIVSMYTIQFIPPRDRQALIDKIYRSLNWGGAFILFEKTRAPDARFQDISTTLYQEFKLDAGYSLEEILGKSLSLKGVLEPFSYAGNIGLLQRAGFVDVNPMFKYICFEGFLCIK